MSAAMCKLTEAGFCGQPVLEDSCLQLLLLTADELFGIAQGLTAQGLTAQGLTAQEKPH